MLDIISIFINLLRLVLWPSMWSILENVPCALENDVYSVAFGWNVLYIFIKFILSNESFKASVSLLVFYLDDLSIDMSGMLKFPTIIVLLSISPFMYVNIYFMYLGAPMLAAYIYNYYSFFLK